jgi:dolichol kinase
MDDDFGFKFWLKVAGLFVAGAIGLFVVSWIFLSVIYAWSFLGALLLLAVVALSLGWIHDRRTASHEEGSY